MVAKNIASGVRTAKHRELQNFIGLASVAAASAANLREVGLPGRVRMEGGYGVTGGGVWSASNAVSLSQLC